MVETQLIELARKDLQHILKGLSSRNFRFQNHFTDVINYQINEIILSEKKLEKETRNVMSVDQWGETKVKKIFPFEFTKKTKITFKGLGNSYWIVDGIKSALPGEIVQNRIIENSEVGYELTYKDTPQGPKLVDLSDNTGMHFGESTSAKKSKLHPGIIAVLFIIGLIGILYQNLDLFVEGEFGKEQLSVGMERDVFENEQFYVRAPIGWEFIESDNENFKIVAGNYDTNSTIIVYYNFPYFEGMTPVEIMEYRSPQELLQGNFDYVVREIEENPETNVSNFQQIEEAQIIEYKGLPAAIGVYSIYQSHPDRIDTNLIREILFFKGEDIYDISLNSWDSRFYDENEDDFEDFLDNLIIKE